MAAAGGLGRLNLEKPRTTYFSGKTVPQTEHKKHYRTLQGGVNTGDIPRYRRLGYTLAAAVLVAC